MNKKNIVTWILFFLAFFFIFQLFQKKKDVAPELAKEAFAVMASDTEYASGEEVIIKLRNNTTDAITLESNCPKNPFKVLAWTNEKFEERSAETKINCDSAGTITVAPQSETSITYSYWNNALFGNPGRYKVEVALKSGTTTGSFVSPEFSVVEAGFWRKFFRTIFYQPLYNILVFFISIAPGRDLGFAIILLTLLIRVILLIPSQHAIVSQRRMQELQPKLEHIKKKYAGNQEKIASETMALWKENKVSPFGSCLPLLVQFPVLIALFYVIRNGLNPDNIYLLYGPLKNLDLSAIHTNFLGILELTRMNVFALPLIVGGLQFLQMKLAMLKKKPSADSAEEQKPAKGSEMDMANKTMVYIMPVMIAMFTASVPAGVGLYWGVSTAFAIGQQIIANRKAAAK